MGGRWSRERALIFSRLFTFLDSHSIDCAPPTSQARRPTSRMANKTQDSFSARFHDYGDLPDTPPAHIWALKALRNQLLGTRPSPLVTGNSLDDDIDEVRLSTHNKTKRILDQSSTCPDIPIESLQGRNSQNTRNNYPSQIRHIQQTKPLKYHNIHNNTRTRNPQGETNKYSLPQLSRKISLSIHSSYPSFHPGTLPPTS